MKIRIGFVSNSSSSSFVMLLDGLSDKALKILEERVNKHNRESEEGCLNMGKRFLFGSLDYHTEFNYQDLNIPKENIEWGD